MDADGSLFLEACGASGPLRVEWDDWSTGRVEGRTLDGASAVVGRGPGVDLVLDHPRVSVRHAYLQVVEGRLLAVDLDSREGLRWSGIPRLSGWVGARRPVTIGPASLRVVGGEGPRDGPPAAGPGPLTSRFESRHRLPGAALEFLDAGGARRSWSFDRVLTLVGGSADCKVRLATPDASRFACALVLTPVGVWMVDLRSSRGVTVNGAPSRRALLDDGDVLRVGDRAVRLTYGGPGPGAAPAVAGAAAAALSGASAEAVLRRLREAAEGPGDDPSAPDLLRAALALAGALGEARRGQLEAVRAEVEQIRLLGAEVAALRALAAPPAPPGARALPPPAADDGPAPTPAPAPADPAAIGDLVGGKLAAWERERRGRWRRVVGLLTGP